ncbi:TPT-domain-containing protein, partial [Aureobasidium melanogenum]
MTSTMTQVPEPRTFTHRSLSPHKRANDASPNEKFPSFDEHRINFPNGPSALADSPSEISPGQHPNLEFKWPVRKASQRLRDARNSGVYTHRPRRSVSDAINKFRTRQGSVSENAHELAEALKAPVSYKLIALCIIWYMTSALTNTSSKSILNALPKPATLTIVQFASVSFWCLVLTGLSSTFPSLKRAVPALKNGLRRPSWDVFYTAFPLSIFQLLGHLLSSYATSKIPVSLVHTIKGLSPLFTVLAYRVVFRIRYKRATYLSLIPLTLGVMLACSTDFSTNFWGIGASLVAAIVFVSQNIFSKKLFTEAARAEAEGQAHMPRKLDKLNLLCYCSVGAFLLSAPVWLYTEGFELLHNMWTAGAVPLSEKKGAMDHGELMLEYVFNGLFHFFQNIMAFVLLSMLSPVSYSVASLIKRVFVIVGAIIWFRSPTTAAQVVGIALTCLGLYLYDRTSMEDAAERRTRADHFRHKAALLPVTEVQTPGLKDSYAVQDDYMAEMSESHPKRDDSRHRAHDNAPSGWLPPGTKQEDTWEVKDQQEKR